MTKTQFLADTTVQRALQRAKEQNIHIFDEGMNGEGCRYWHVSSSRERYLDGAGRGYTVTLCGCNALTCDCQAGIDGIYCKHRAIVTAHIIKEYEAVKANEQAAMEAASTTTRRYQDAWNVAMDKAAARIQRREQLREARKVRA